GPDCAGTMAHTFLEGPTGPAVHGSDAGRRSRGSLTALSVDTGAFLKLLWAEPETNRVEEILAAEDDAVVSDLARLELAVQIQSRRAGGLLARAGAERILRQ